MPYVPTKLRRQGVKNRKKKFAPAPKRGPTRHMRKVDTGEVVVRGDPMEALRATVEGFARACNTGNVEVSFTPGDGDLFTVNIIDLSRENESSQDAPDLMTEAETLLETEMETEALSHTVQEGDEYVDGLVKRVEEEQIRTNEEIADMLSLPEMLTARDFAQKMGISQADVEEMREHQEIIGLRGVSRRYKYPIWQIRSVGLNRRILDGISEMLEMADGDAWGVYNFLITHGPDTKRPMYALLESNRRQEVFTWFQVFLDVRSGMDFR